MFLLKQVLVFIGVFAASKFLLEWWNDKKRLKQRYPPSLPTLPLVGSLPFLRKLKRIPEFFMEKSEELGPIFTFRAGSQLVLVLNNKDLIEEAYVKNAQAFSGRKRIFLERLANPNEKGIAFASTSPEWKRYHKLSLSIMREFGFGVKNVMEMRILREVEPITEYVRQKEGRAFNPHDLSHLATSNIIMNILFGRRREYNLGVAELVTNVNRWIDSLEIAFDITPLLRFVPYFRERWMTSTNCNKKIYQLLEEEIPKSIQGGNDACFVTRYIEKEGANYDHEQLKYILRDLIAGGSDTSANTLMWFFIALVQFPDVQTRLHLEIDSVLPHDRLPSLADQVNLPFVEATILEVMRWRTLVPMSGPRVTLCDSTIGGYFIPKDVFCQMSTEYT